MPEAVDHGRRQRQHAPARRSRADLLERSIAALGGRVMRIDIEADGVPLFRARVTVRQGERVISLEGRPSDAVALAAAFDALAEPVRRVLAEAGLSPDDVARLGPHRAPPEEEQIGVGAVQRF
jgi:bifunctional DNase/RNase